MERSISVEAELDRKQRSAEEADAIEITANASPLDFLQAVYRSPNMPLHSRLKASIEAAQYCHPKLSVTANVNSEDFAKALERATRRSAKVRTQPQSIEPLLDRLNRRVCGALNR
jgi:hypothetical protein